MEKGRSNDLPFFFCIKVFVQIKSTISVIGVVTYYGGVVVSLHTVCLTEEKYKLSQLDYPKSLLYEGIEYSCAWSAYIAQHFDSITTKKEIAKMSAHTASRYLASQKGWSTVASVDTVVLEEIVRLKFLHKKTRQNLLLTKDNTILYGKDNVGFILGCYMDEILTRGIVGENILGVIIQRIRDEYLATKERKVLLPSLGVKV